MFLHVEVEVGGRADKAHRSGRGRLKSNRDHALTNFRLNAVCSNFPILCLRPMHDLWETCAQGRRESSSLLLLYESRVYCNWRRRLGVPGLVPSRHVDTRGYKTNVADHSSCSYEE